jgi:glutamate/tyrosine decarboxylase-like PLP-dependent enzyme
VERRTLGWNDQSVLEAFSSMRDADSITIDPHKTGYIPYPAGAVVFKDAHVRDLMTQRAQYIASEDVQPDAQESFAPFILEGSKPGAAAAACWVAHKAIPLDSQGHGLLMKECVLNAQRLAFYLKEYHRTRENSGRLGGRDIPIVPFAFVPICLPDTNVVTFVAVPTLSLPNGNIQPVTNQLGRDLNWLNTLNKAVHQELSITVKKDRNEKVTRTFFISQTEFSHQQYSAESLEDLLELIDVNQSEYREVGLLVLRATVMNPFYRHAKEEGEDLLLEFVKHLNQVVEQKLRENWT